MPDFQGIKNKIEAGIKKIKQPEIKTSEAEIKAAETRERAAGAAAGGVARQEVLAEIKRAEEGGVAAAVGASAPQQTQKRQKEIEKVLEAGLEGTYLSMPPVEQQEFMIAGEETARKISVLLGQAKIKFKKIIALIKKWLSLIPGVNKFFLEQEAKIKADEIIKLKKDL